MAINDERDFNFHVADFIYARRIIATIFIAAGREVRIGKRGNCHRALLIVRD